MRSFEKENTSILEILAFDISTKNPIFRAEISVFLISVNIINHDEDLENENEKSIKMQNEKIRKISMQYRDRTHSHNDNQNQNQNEKKEKEKEKDMSSTSGYEFKREKYEKPEKYEKTETAKTEKTEKTEKQLISFDNTSRSHNGVRPLSASIHGNIHGKSQNDQNRPWSASPQFSQEKLKEISELNSIKMAQEKEKEKILLDIEIKKEKKLKKSGIAARSQSLDNVRTWTKNDVRSWFREYGASEEVVENALFAGVIDGPSFSSE